MTSTHHLPLEIEVTSRGPRRCRASPRLEARRRGASGRAADARAPPCPRAAPHESELAVGVRGWAWCGRGRERCDALESVRRGERRRACGRSGRSTSTSGKRSMSTAMARDSKGESSVECALRVSPSLADWSSGPLSDGLTGSSSSPPRQATCVSWRRLFVGEHIGDNLRRASHPDRPSVLTAQDEQAIPRNWS